MTPDEKVEQGKTIFEGLQDKHPNKQRHIQMLLNSVMNYCILLKLILQQHMLRRRLEVFKEVPDQLVLMETK